jgi:hypothetical protein
MPIAETIITIELDKPYKMYFNANCMCAFEEATGKNFLETVAKLYDAYKPMLEAQKAGMQPGESAAATQIIKQVPIKDLSALIWAGIHTYDERDEPHWPMTLGQVRRMITITSIPQLFLSFLRGQSDNSPTVREMGESPAPPDDLLKTKSGTAQRLNGKPADDGGETSTELPADAFN